MDNKNYLNIDTSIGVSAINSRVVAVRNIKTGKVKYVDITACDRPKPKFEMMVIEKKTEKITFMKKVHYFLKKIML